MGANVHCQEGNNPDRQLRSLKLAKWETKWEAVEKSSPNRAIESLGVDPKPGDLSMARMKVR